MTRGGGRPKGYYAADGKRLPSVTTITGRFKDSGALLKWAWNQGRDGFDLYETRDKAAEAGSIVHGWIEDYLHGDVQREVDTDGETVAKAQAGFEAFLAWARMNDLHVVETETPLVSERYRYGGTLDCVAVVSGLATLLDWKASNAVYPEYVVQLAAYRQLLRERAVDADEGGAPGAPDTALLLRVGKTYADFHLHHYPAPVLDMGWRWFLHAREMYDLDREIKGVAA